MLQATAEERDRGHGCPTTCIEQNRSVPVVLPPILGAGISVPLEQPLPGPTKGGFALEAVDLVPLETECRRRLGLVGRDDSVRTQDGAVDEVALGADIDDRARLGKLGQPEERRQPLRRRSVEGVRHDAPP
jgi:hypothetical protein